MHFVNSVSRYVINCDVHLYKKIIIVRILFLFFSREQLDDIYPLVKDLSRLYR